MMTFNELLIAFELLHSSGVYVHCCTFIRFSAVVLWHIIATPAQLRLIISVVAVSFVADKAPPVAPS
ncbi:hypothetical protein, partial [Shigella sonnei]|uniref:hypothetical protein n=1 Tax=Shigella sonnei TaxID=624 RepID=UPI001C0A7741